MNKSVYKQLVSHWLTKEYQIKWKAIFSCKSTTNENPIVFKKRTKIYQCFSRL